MPHAHWYEPVLRFLAAQPPETTDVVLTYAQMAALVGGELPVNARTRHYWWGHTSGTMGPHLTAIGWRVAHVRGRPATFTFKRQPPDTTA